MALEEPRSNGALVELDNVTVLGTPSKWKMDRDDFHSNISYTWEMWLCYKARLATICSLYEDREDTKHYFDNLLSGRDWFEEHRRLNHL